MIFKAVTGANLQPVAPDHPPSSAEAAPRRRSNERASLAPHPPSSAEPGARRRSSGRTSTYHPGSTRMSLVSDVKPPDLPKAHRTPRRQKTESIAQQESVNSNSNAFSPRLSCASTATISDGPDQARTPRQVSVDSDPPKEAPAVDIKLQRQVEKLSAKGWSIEEVAEFLEMEVKHIAPYWECSGDVSKVSGG